MKKYFRYLNGKIHYTDLGAGNVIVLLHGYLETSEIWERFATRLANDFRVITLDIPGHGKSDMCRQALTMDFIADIVKELLNNLGIKKAFFVGHSLGGYVSLAFAEIYPEMLSGYCLFHSHPFADTPETLGKREREITLVKAGKKDLIYPDNVSKMFASSNLPDFQEALKRSKQIASSIPGEGIIAVLQGMMTRPSRLDVMEEGKVPCFWILGAMDNYIDCNSIRTKVKLPSNAETVILKKSGHLGFIEEEERSAIAISEFIRKIFSFSGNQSHISV